MITSRLTISYFLVAILGMKGFYFHRFMANAFSPRPHTSSSISYPKSWQSSSSRRLPETRDHLLRRQRLFHTWSQMQQYEDEASHMTRSIATYPTSSKKELPFLRDLNPSQYRAATLPQKCIARVVAGPGSGKTRVLTCRIAYLLQMDQNQRVLGVTFTRKAAGEMKDRIANLLTTGNYPSSMLERVTLGTFHSTCATILRWNGAYLQSLNNVQDILSHLPLEATNVPLEGTFTIVDSSEQVRVLNKCLDELNIDLKFYNLKPFAILNLMGNCKDALAQGENPFVNKKDASSSDGKPPSKALEIVERIYRNYQHALWSNNQVDFDDLILLTRQLLIDFPDVRERLHSRWPHLLVDEFQDTSRSQMDLVQLLTKDSLFVVGDADQCIYTWRGAHANSLVDFVDAIQSQSDNDHVETVYLMENYRSTTNIVRAAQKVINKAYGEVDSGENTASNGLRQDMKPKRGKGSSPRIIACKDDGAEAAYVVQCVKDMMLAGKCTSGSSLGFIYRTNAQSRVLEEALVKQNIPYVIFGSATSFYKRQEIRDCLCFLRWLYDGRDKASMLRAFKTPPRGIGPATIEEFETYCSLVAQVFSENRPGDAIPSPLDVLIGFTSSDRVMAPEVPPPEDTISKRGMNALVTFATDMRKLRETAETKPIKDVISVMIETFNFLAYLDKISKTTTEFEDRKANVAELHQASERYHENAALETMILSDEDDGFQSQHTPLGAFLDDVALITDMADEAERSKEDRFVVSLMTVHASKGMEFDTVFVVGMEDGTLPGFQAVEDGEGSIAFQEEQRLCYVAMTRAKTELYLTWRQKVPVFTQQGVRYVERSRSRFLDVLVKEKDGEKRMVREAPQPFTNSKTSSIKLGTRSVYSTSTPAGRSRIEAPGVRQPRKPSPNDTPIRPGRYDMPRNTNTYGSGSPRKVQNLTTAKQPRPTMTPRVVSPATPTSRRQFSKPSPTPVPSEPKSMSPERPRDQASDMDSTWFYPVGSDVQHSNFGRGTVLPPKSKETVYVRFETGKDIELSVEDARLVPALT